MGVNIFHDIRLSINHEDVYTSSIFTNYWKKLSVEDIITGHFEPEHLLTIGVGVPDVNLILNDLGMIDILTFKRLLPYSDPSDNNIERILNDINRNINDCTAIHHYVIILVRYKRQLMMNYQDHPFVKQLLELLSYKTMKNSRINDMNH